MSPKRHAHFFPIHTSGPSGPLCPTLCNLQLTNPVDGGLRQLRHIEVLVIFPFPKAPALPFLPCCLGASSSQLAAAIRHKHLRVQILNLKYYWCCCCCCCCHRVALWVWRPPVTGKRGSSSTVQGTGSVGGALGRCENPSVFGQNLKNAAVPSWKRFMKLLGAEQKSLHHSLRTNDNILALTLCWMSFFLARIFIRALRCPTAKSVYEL